MQLNDSNELNALLKSWNDTATDYPREATVHGLFSECAALNPHPHQMSPRPTPKARKKSKAPVNRCPASPKGGARLSLVFDVDWAFQPGREPARARTG